MEPGTAHTSRTHTSQTLELYVHVCILLNLSFILSLHAHKISSAVSEMQLVKYNSSVINTSGRLLYWLIHLLKMLLEDKSN